jgi:hypothetical protein
LHWLAAAMVAEAVAAAAVAAAAEAVAAGAGAGAGAAVVVEAVAVAAVAVVAAVMAAAAVEAAALIRPFGPQDRAGCKTGHQAHCCTTSHQGTGAQHQWVHGLDVLNRLNRL